MTQILTETLRLVGGQRAEGTPPGIIVLTPPLQPARQRAAETFAMLLDMGEQAPSWLYRQVRAAAARDFWSTPGGVTAAIRHAILAANRSIFHYNLQVTPPQRVYGAISCAALTESEVFMAQAGPACAWAMCAGSLERFPRQSLPPLGSGAYLETEVTYLPVQAGDRLIIASYHLARTASDDALQRVLGLEERAAMMDALEQVATGQACYALAVCWAEEPAPARAAPRRKRPRRSVEAEPLPVEPLPSPVVPAPSPSRVIERETPPRPTSPTGMAVGEVATRLWEPVETGVFDEPEFDEPEADLQPSARPALAGRLDSRLQIGTRLQRAWRSLSASVAGATARLRLLRRRVPRQRRTAIARPRRERRAPQPENARLMAGIAAGILLITAIVTALAWANYGGAARREQALSQAEWHATQAREATAQDEQRSHWTSVIQVLTTAGLADEAEGATLIAEAQGYLDQLDNVVRINPTLLWPSEGTSAAQRLVVHGSYVFLLDGEQQSVTKLSMTATGESMIPDNHPLLQSGEERNDQLVGSLIDMAWNQSSGEWPMDCLMVLDTDNQLWIYDAAWPDNTYAMPLPFSAGQGTPVAVETYEGRLYLLDCQAQQVWRYLPRSTGYVEEAEPYFSAGTPQSMAQARDMAIDGNVYLLLEDGSVVKYFDGNPVSFEVRGVPPPTPHFSAIEVDPDLAGRIYLADTAAERIVILNEGGDFRSQMRAPAGTMQGLQALALDPANSRLFFLAGGHLYSTPLPSMP